MYGCVTAGGLLVTAYGSARISKQKDRLINLVALGGLCDQSRRQSKLEDGYGNPLDICDFISFLIPEWSCLFGLPVELTCLGLGAFHG